MGAENPYRLADGRLNPNFDHERHNREELVRRLRHAQFHGYKTIEDYERDETALYRNLNTACRTVIF